ncbi:MAG: SDR family oxidoreductase [Candidatus Marinimicrobia bacterium]|nr:SDR family oxidoreductase [Candidatus Neomarinimicrobiota bacterium]
MKILVAGGAGYIGSRLVPVLLEKGYDVSVLDLLWFGNHLPPEVEIIEKDIFDIDISAVEGFDQVIFLAGLSNDPMAEFAPSMNFISNASAPAYLAYLAKKSGASRFILAASCSVYGYTVNELYDEESPTTCSYPYGISKLQGEVGVLQQVDENFSVICIRQGTISGYSPRMRFDLLVNTMFMAGLNKRKITINNPSIWRPLLGIEDAVNMYINAVQAEPSVNGIFNALSANYTVGEVGETVFKHLKNKHSLNIELEIKDIQDFRNYKVSNNKAVDVLGAKFDDSVESILEDLDNHFSVDFNFDKEEYFNIKVFENIIN